MNATPRWFNAARAAVAGEAAPGRGGPGQPFGILTAPLDIDEAV